VRKRTAPHSITVPTTGAVDAHHQDALLVLHPAEPVTADSKRHNGDNPYQEILLYAQIASRSVTLNGRKFRPFAPFHRSLSAYKTLTRWQGALLIALLLGYGCTLWFYGLKSVAVLLGLIILLYISALLLNFVVSVIALNRPGEEQIDDASIHELFDVDWPGYTILCPLYREVSVVPQFLQAMQALDYPTDKLQILLLTEEDDAETRAAIKAMRLPRHFSIVTVPDGQPRTKPRACNFGLLLAMGEYVVIYDAEDIPEPLQLKKAVLTFANHDADLACVQAKLNYYNAKQNLLTRWFTAEYSLWFDLILPGMQAMQLPLPLGGTSNHFRAEMLRRVGAWDPFNVTEDCDLGLRLAYYHLKTTMLDSTTYEEANSQVKNWIRQRSRWIKGYLQTYLVYMRHPLRYVRQRGFRGFLSLQLVIGGKTLVLFINPLMWVLLALYFPLRPILADVYQEIFPKPVLYLGLTCLFVGNFFYLYTLLIGCMKREQYGLIKWALFAPIYWAMMSIAAYRALYQLFLKPHYWEKTKHGLHLRPSHPAAHSAPVKVKPIHET
jgi:cellulose synthase/poly-beta-1,6-N-acetylglucosamine synthase-like glycosyltransferase